jgi:hypothetical protein
MHQKVEEDIKCEKIHPDKLVGRINELEISLKNLQIQYEILDQSYKSLFYLVEENIQNGRLSVEGIAAINNVTVWN